MKKCLFTILTVLPFLGCNSDDNNLNIENNCDFTSEIITEDNFNAIDTSNYAITNIELNGDCLIITFNSSNCDIELSEENLYSTDAFFNIFPLQRALKMELINDDTCQTVFQKTVSFSLTAFQIDGQNEIPLKVEGWKEQIIYEY